MAIRAKHLTMQPLCVMCQAKGRLRVAVEVDHIVPLSKGGPDDDTNRQSLCKPCHKDKTRADRGLKPRPLTGADGWPVQGS